MHHLSPSKVHPCIPALVGKLAELGAKRVILYGSRARGDNSPHADIDLAIDWPGHTSHDWLHISDAVENASTLLEIDFVFLDTATGEFLDNILKDGKVLYDRE